MSTCVREPLRLLTSSVQFERSWKTDVNPLMADIDSPSIHPHIGIDPGRGCAFERIERGGSRYALGIRWRRRADDAVKLCDRAHCGAFDSAGGAPFHRLDELSRRVRGPRKRPDGTRLSHHRTG